MKAVAIILAAGEARRMAHPKALIEHEGGRSFLQSLASTFGKAGCAVLGVIGKDAEAVRDQHPSVNLVDSPRWQEGPMSSIKAGLMSALEEGADVVLLQPVDMPAVRASTLKSLLKAMGDSEEGLRPEFEAAPGFPVVLSRAAAEQLMGSDEAQLDAALQAMKLRRVSVKDPGVVVNINTPETYERLFGTPPRLAPPPKRRMKKISSPEMPAVQSSGMEMSASPEE
ncbi:MAG: NTP transferase domain-containing protein [Hyalangium sp.]|uniref:nucleotidyltransferase family protein n=1 Tax=Hyalangium sp. TaxID=2028555 RepID=UPI00389A003C